MEQNQRRRNALNTFMRLRQGSTGVVLAERAITGKATNYPLVIMVSRKTD